MSSFGRTMDGGEQATYRIGQNKIINSTLQQPKMAEIASLTTMEIGATSVYSESAPMYRPTRRVSGDDHMPDPSYSPVGDVPWILMMLLVAAYVIRLKLHTKVQKKRARTE